MDSLPVLRAASEIKVSPGHTPSEGSREGSLLASPTSKGSGGSGGSRARGHSPPTSAFIFTWTFILLLFCSL